jgi:rod shape-determining protein MreD
MGVLHRQRWCGATGLVVPLLTLASPGFLKIAAVAPSWAVLWLLPWALVDGPASGAVAGLLLGTVLDALHLGNASEVPALMLLGWWWGRLGRRGPPIERSFNLGLLALLGTALLGATLLLQLRWQGALPTPHVAAQILLAQCLITALLAPVLCSLQLLRWRQVASLRG